MFLILAVCASSLALVFALPAHAQHLFDPEIGIKRFDGDMDDEITPGISFGSTYGRIVSESVAVTVHADVGLHDARRHGDVFVDPGGSFDWTLGVMMSPALREGERRASPYLDVNGGYGLAGANGSSASSATLGLEGGVRIVGRASRGVSLGARIARHFWKDPRGATSSNAYVVALRWLFRLPA